MTASPSSPSAPTGDTPQGLAFALAAYGLWGFLPLYLKLLDHVGPVEVVAHRIIWSIPVAGVVLVLTGRTRDIAAAIRTPRMLAMAFVTAALISANWSIYVFAIASDRALDAALGYYINPLFSVFLGAVLLGERLSRLQLVAVAMAGAAVLVLTLEAGSLPLTSLALTVSWGFYALAKKQLPIGPNQGFLLEVLILVPFALGYLIWLGEAGIFARTLPDSLLLIGCGLVTAIPLMLYANGAKRLRLTTIGILQYVAPTMIFLIAVFVFKEPVGQGRMIAFPLIWAALVVYSVSLFRGRR